MATVAELQAELDGLKADLSKINHIQRYSAPGRSVDRRPIIEIEQKIAALESRIARKNRGNGSAPIFIQNR